MSQSPQTASATYRCIECGQEFTGLGAEYWAHAAEHKPFEALCADGYTRMFRTAEDAEAARTRKGVESLAVGDTFRDLYLNKVYNVVKVRRVRGGRINVTTDSGETFGYGPGVLVGSE